MLYYKNTLDFKIIQEIFCKFGNVIVSNQVRLVHS